MTSRHFAGAVAFAFVVTWATVGAVDAILAAGACALVVNARTLAAWLRTLQRPAPKPRRAPRRRVAYELVPDEPSLVLSVQQ